MLCNLQMLSNLPWRHHLKSLASRVPGILPILRLLMLSKIGNLALRSTLVQSSGTLISSLFS
jgi:hypothetical protein